LGYGAWTVNSVIEDCLNVLVVVTQRRNAHLVMPQDITRVATVPLAVKLTFLKNCDVDISEDLDAFRQTI
jgi:hypothetical protein